MQTNKMASKSKIYLNTAACGLLSNESVHSVTLLNNAMITEGSTVIEALKETGVQRIRETVASFLQAQPSHIAFVPNFSYALNSVVQSLKGSEKVLLYVHDYPSLIEPFKINKFDITWVETTDSFTISVEAIKELSLKHDINIIAISHVQWLTGFKIDIQELSKFCKQHDIILILDTTHSTGAIPLSIRHTHLDVLIFSNYKWMNAGFGTGVMYMSHSFLSNYEPVVGGFGSYSMIDGISKYVPSVKSYEPGHLNFHGLLVLEEAIKQKLKLGIDSIEQHNMKLAKLFLDNVKNVPIVGPCEIDNRSSIIVIKDESGKLFEYLKENGIVVTRRNGTVRVSMHFYNTEEEVLKVAELIAVFEE